MAFDSICRHPEFGDQPIGEIMIEPSKMKSFLPIACIALLYPAIPENALASSGQSDRIAEVSAAQILRGREKRAESGVDRARVEEPVRVSGPDIEESPETEDEQESDEREGRVIFRGDSLPARLDRMDGVAATVEVDIIGSADTRHQRSPESWRDLRFAGGGMTPGYGIDSALEQLIASRSQSRPDKVYAFILFNDRLSGEIRQSIESRSVRLLGRHSNHYKASIPVDQLSALSNLPYVDWIGLSLPEQKLSPGLNAIRSGDGAWRDREVPVLINLFDGDASEMHEELLASRGATVGKFYESIGAFAAIATGSTIEQLLELDAVLYIEPITRTSAGHDQSMPMMAADMIRPGGSGTRFDGTGITLGILDTGFELGGGGHADLNKNGCGANFTDDTAGVWDDEHGHGTHVLATIAGTGAADSRYRGVAPGLGNTTRIRAGKIYDAGGGGQGNWTLDGMEFLGQEEACSNPRPEIVNISGGGNGGSDGTDASSRMADTMVWDNRQLYVSITHNDGPGANTARSPGAAKNVLGVGNVQDFGFENVGEIAASSGRGPTGDGRIKPNVVAPGRWITSADSANSNGYRNSSGTSMAAPHVAGIAATLMEHRDFYVDRPWAARARFMASSFLHEDDTSLPNVNTYGLGRVSSYTAHWGLSGANGWTYFSSSRFVNANNYGERQITVDEGTERLVVVMTWDEPAASSGDSEARLWDLELWIDVGHTCQEHEEPRCGNLMTFSYVDNVIYRYIDNPTPGTYNIKAVPWDAPDDYSLRVGLVAKVIRGNTQPDLQVAISPSTTRPLVGDELEVTTTVSTSSYVASGVHLANTYWWGGLPRQHVETQRRDGETISFGNASHFTLGDVVRGRSRTSTWTFNAQYAGCSPLRFRAWSQNAGTTIEEVEVCAGSLPGTPGSPQASEGEYFDRVEVDWQGVSGADHYEVWRSGTPYLAGTMIDQVNVTALTDLDVTSGQEYFYRVRAVNEWGNSSLTDYASGWALERTDEVFDDRFEANP